MPTPAHAVISAHVASLGSLDVLYDCAFACNIITRRPHDIPAMSFIDRPKPRAELTIEVYGSLSLFPFAGFSGGSGSGSKQTSHELALHFRRKLLHVRLE